MGKPIHIFAFRLKEKKSKQVIMQFLLVPWLPRKECPTNRMIKSDTSNPFPTSNIFDPTTWKDKTTTKNAHLAKNLYIDSPKK